MSGSSDDDRGQMSSRAMLALFIGVLVAAVLLGPIVTVTNDHTGAQDITNETVSAQHDTYVDLDGYDIDENSETVWGHNDTSGSYEQLPGSDYQMDYQGGRINVSSSSTVVQDGEDVKVSYTYQATDTTTTLIVGFVPVMAAALILGVIGFKIQEMMG